MDNGQKDPQKGPQTILLGAAEAQEVKSIRNFLIIALVFCICSVIIAGIPFSIAGMVCAIIALRKTLKLSKRKGNIAQVAQRFKIFSIVVIVACAVTLVLSVVTAVVLYPLVMEAVQSGEYSKLVPSGTDSSGGSSTWG